MSETDFEPEAVSSEPEPCPILSVLYDSSRPAVELTPTVPLSPIVNACWIVKDAKKMMEENWIPAPVEDAEGATTLPKAFEPKSTEYNEMQRRLSKTEPLVKWNALTIKIKELEHAITTTKGEEMDANKLALDEAKAMLQDATAILGELKSSFTEDPLSLVPWVQNLFDLADAGLTTFEVSGNFYPYCGLKQLFTADNTGSYYDGVEKVLGYFKRRYEKERGHGKIQILTKLVPNIFQDGYNVSMVETIVTKIKSNIYGGETADSIDLILLYWFDFKERDVLPTLKALQKLTEDKVEINPETGEEIIIEPRKVRGIGLLDFPAAAVKAAVQAGVTITSVSLSHTLVDRSNQSLLALCKEYNIKILARDGILGGLVNEKFIGVPCPDSKDVDPDLDNVAHSLDLVAKAGGWDAMQRVLTTIRGIAVKHDVKMQTVALRWQIDAGAFPVVSCRWHKDMWKQFGHRYIPDPSKPGVDAKLFQKASFLDFDDVNALMSLYK